MKRIVVCCDGTWNTPDKSREGVPLATNVVKIAEAVTATGPDGVEQRLYYGTGVGTDGGRWARTWAGMTGKGLAANLLDAYLYLIHTYEPGDQLFLFGFSRGAYTVRSLGGLIRNSGILRSEHAGLVERAFALYQSREPGQHPKRQESVLFRRTYAHGERATIRMIGVWDTVGSLGNPLYSHSVFNRRHQFHDTDLSKIVEFAYHAVAIDEVRRPFEAALWHKPADHEGQILEQCWFAGVHADVGGGYPHTGLSDLALDWMAHKAAALGLGLAPLQTQPDPLAPREESRKGLYTLLPRHHRPIARPDPNSGATCEVLHPSVLERYRQDASYRPKNLEDYFERHPEQRP